LADPAAPPEVLGYFWMEQNRRPSLMPALIENPAIDENMLTEAAATGCREVVTLLLASPRARSAPGVVEALSSNPSLLPEELQQLQAEPPPPAEAPAVDDAESEAAHEAWSEQHASEIAAEEGKGFELVASSEEEKTELPVAPVVVGSATTLAVTALAAGMKPLPGDEKKLSLLQRVARMN